MDILTATTIFIVNCKAHKRRNYISGTREWNFKMNTYTLNFQCRTSRPFDISGVTCFSIEDQVEQKKLEETHDQTTVV